MNYLTESAITEFIDLAIREDVGDGDHSALASIPADAQNKARLIIKGEGIVAGIEMAEKIFKRVDAGLKMEVTIPDGVSVKYGDIAFTVSGNARSILTSERLVLNCMQRMSGIATATNELKGLIRHTQAKLLDTRKTTPNFRIMEKWAVAIGGGGNHRFGLFDMIILKDNHVDYAGGVEKAIKATHSYLSSAGRNLKIEIEIRNLEEVNQVLAIGGVDRIMLDNMSIEMLRKAVELINHRFETEASGGINKKNIVKVAETGVDYISVGALTHSSQSMDMSLKAF
ncbi:MAG TPA: carboxylating nicotinate-nucleotide diphosphorylase [Cytophagaceae bacterium]|nr:carboxylating nicotinate-nucleotide diphosphorylase [Cytophagaceae bacterium]